MSEKRFTKTERNCYYTSLIFDNHIQEELGTTKVVDLLNTMSNEIEEVGISIKLFEDDVQIKDKKIEEQQSIIESKDSLLSVLSKENEQLRKQVAECMMILRQHEFAKQEGFE